MGDSAGAPAAKSTQIGTAASAENPEIFNEDQMPAIGAILPMTV
jgi:hypothetical protein